jgi:hypothetical protein
MMNVEKNTTAAHFGPGEAGKRRSHIFEQYAALFEQSPYALPEKLSDFAKFVPREALGRFLVKYEIFKRVLGVQGSVLECGVYAGAGLIAMAQISELLEPLNHQRSIVGFDTFAGFPAVSEHDTSDSQSVLRRAGELASDRVDLEKSIELLNSTRYLKHIPKVKLVVGDMCETIPQYVQQNPHLVVSLLYLDADLYEPTKVALDHLVPRMPRGSVIAFDELNDPFWPGETQAVLEGIGIRNLRIERSFATSISFAVLD